MSSPEATHMQRSSDKRVVITGGSAGLGLAMAKALIGHGARVTAIARDAHRLAAAASIGAATIAGDATDAALMNRVVADEQPDVLILNAGARLPMGPIDEQTWESFSAMWLSGGCIGAKRMQWFMAHSANAVSRQRGLGIHFQVILPMQVIGGTAFGQHIASAYAEIEGVTPDHHILNTYGTVLLPEQVGEHVTELLNDPRYARGVAYGIRANVGLVPLDVGTTRPTAGEANR